MEAISDIVARGNKRADDAGFPYAGALTPNEAYDVLQGTENAVLIDVRTQAELELVGRIPDVANIEWASYPDMVANPDFAKQLEAKVDQAAVVIFMCRTGGRSHNAAALAASLGFNQAYNMLEGFEGEANTERQRTLINGWRHAGLPWSN